MTKNKTVGILNLLVGVGEIFTLAPLFLVIANLNKITSDLAQKSNVNLTSSYVVLLLLVATSLLTLFFGIKCLVSKELGGGIFISGVVVLVSSVILTAILSTISYATVIVPIYQLTSQF